MHWFFLVARIAEVSFYTVALLSLPLLIATIHRARVVHPLMRLFLTLFVVFLGASALLNTVVAVLSIIKESPDRLRSLVVQLDVKHIPSLCQILACNCTVLAWLAFTFCSLERFASTRNPDRYDRRYRTREATVIAVSFFIPISVILIMLQYTRKTDIVFVAEMGALFSVNLLVHQGFLRLSKHIFCWGTGALLVLIWAIIVERTSTDASFYESIYFMSIAAVFLLIIYLLLTEPVLQPALRSFMLSRWILRTSSGTLPVTRISDTTLAVTTQDTWRANLHIDIIKTIIRVEGDSIDQMRLISKTWNTLVQEHLNNRNHLIPIRDVIVEKSGKTGYILMNIKTNAKYSSRIVEEYCYDSIYYGIPYHFWSNISRQMLANGLRHFKFTIGKTLLLERHRPYDSLPEVDAYMKVDYSF
ncbi:hypothetical protein PRIPAC_94207 [Pristionchus pacificus]|uniref:Uncharacterized protein n=1 Tax=Pristionchus pacificus TaxID=54126 RepID=A0A2A6BQ57_PRIPA|nr:hypothetical protein PRIPAC_94207 [Pristionchus pacificus]|eukprot:PDM67966.1 hypothetical protein PRIPAC_46010 [Pristionchus pacificus]